MPTFDIALHQERPIDPEAVLALYQQVGWWPERQAPQLAQVLSSDFAIGAWDNQRLIGFARVISDHHFHAYIDDVLIHPDYQRTGIGSLMLAQLLEALHHINTITLFCSSDLLPFYELQGFRAHPSQVVMHTKNLPPEQLAELHL